MTRTDLGLYALPGFPLAVAALPTVIYLPTYYAEELGLGMGAVALAFLAGRLWDLLSDPLVGFFSDRLQMASLGRRKLPMLLGAPLLMASAWQLFMPPDGAGALHLSLWLLVFYSGWTLIFVPYLAWGAELDSSPRQRSRLSGAREGAALAGTLAALSIPLAVGTDTAATLHGMGGLILVSTALALGLCLWGLKEQPRAASRCSWRQSLEALKNRDFLRLWSLFLVNATANALPATLFLLYLRHVIDAEQLAPWLLAGYFIAGLAALPLWLQLSYRIGKQRTWALSMLLASLAFAATPFLGPDDVLIFVLICLVSGFSLGVDMALPASLQADLINADDNGRSPAAAGSYFGLWGLATKLALALAVVVGFGVLGLADFSEQQPSPADRQLLALLYGGLPVLIKVLMLPWVWRFRLQHSGPLQPGASLS